MQHSRIFPQQMAASLAIVAPLFFTPVSAKTTTVTENPQSTLEVVASPFNADGSTEGTGSYTSGPVSSATGLSLTAKDTPQAVSVITRQQMDDVNASSLKQALRWSAGVTESTIDADRSNFIYRGFRVDSYQYDGVPGFFDPCDKTRVDASIFDRIEIVRGATGLLNGMGNPGATVNLIRKKASFVSPFATVALSTASWHNYRATLDAGNALNADGTIRFRLVAAGSHSQSFLDRYQDRSAMLYATAESDLTENTLLRVGADYQQNRPKSSNYGGALPAAWFADGSEINWNRHFNSAPDWSAWNTTFNSQFVTLEHTFGNDWHGVVNYTRSRWTHDNRIGAIYQPSIEPQSWNVKDALVFSMWQQGYQQQHSLDIKLNGDFALLNRQHNFVIGSSAAWRHNYKSNLPPAGYRHPLYTGSLLDWNGNIQQPEWAASGWGDDDRIRQTGIYSSVNFSVTGYWNMLLGARYNYFTKTSANNLVNKSGKIIPFIGTVIKLTPDISAYASYTSIFNNQDLRDKNNQFLPPVEGVNKEIGIKSAFFDDQLTLSLSAFSIVQHHYGVPDADHPPAIYSYHEGKGNSSKGVEIELSGQLAPDWNALFAMTHYSSGIYQERPQTSVITLFTSYQLPGILHHLLVGGGARWNGRMYLTEKDTQGTEHLAEQRSWLLIDLMARYNFTPRTSLQLNLENVLDKKYYADITNGTRNYGTPRNITLMLKHNF